MRGAEKAPRDAPWRAGPDRGALQGQEDHHHEQGKPALRIFSCVRCTCLLGAFSLAAPRFGE
jgi:hypothetical protein